MKLVPLDNKVVVKRMKADMVSSGGIILPDADKQKPERGEVIAVGPGLATQTGQRIPPTVKPGDQIFFSRYAGQEIKVLGEAFLVLLETEIQVIIEP